MLTNYNRRVAICQQPQTNPSSRGVIEHSGVGFPSDVLAAFDLETLTMTSGRPSSTSFL